MGLADSRLEHWVEFLGALPFPAALVDRDEVLIYANDRVEPPEDGRLLAPPEASRSRRRSRAGADGSSRWRVIPLVDDSSIQLLLVDGEQSRHHILQVFFAMGNALFVVFDPAGTVVEANEAWSTTLGFDVEDILGSNAWDLVEDADRAAHQRDIEMEVTRTGRADRMLRVRDNDGRWREMYWTFYYDAGLDRSFGIGRDVTEEREQERILRDSHRTFQQVGDFLLTLDENGLLLSGNPALYRTLEIDPDDAVGSPLRDFVNAEDWDPLLAAALRARDEDIVTEQLMRWRGPSQHNWRWIDGTLSYDADFDRYHIVARDVTAETELTAELERRAFTDELTGLANRARLLAVLEERLATGDRPAVLFFDLDRFKVVNDSLGHHAGDTLLQEFAGLLTRQVRADDSLVARLGGDEFVVVLGDADQYEAAAVAERVIRALAVPFRVHQRMVVVDTSIGIAVAREGPSSDGGRTPEELLGEADTAAYQAKELGRGRYAIFDSEMRLEVNRRFEVEEGLRVALELGRFDVHYQPIVSLANAEITGIEALVRWRTGDGRHVPPGVFLDIAEEAGLIGPIGEQVLVEAIRQGAELRKRGHDLTVSFNVAASQLADPLFVDRVVAATRDAGLPARCVLVEITESAVLEHGDITLENLRGLRRAGVRIGLDDFGTGFSSLSHLRTLPIDVVKIDRTFVAELDQEATRAVTSSILELSSALGLEVIVEGIESAEQLRAVERLGGSWAQGFYFHRPMAPAELEKILPEIARAAESSTLSAEADG